MSLVTTSEMERRGIPTQGYARTYSLTDGFVITRRFFRNYGAGIFWDRIRSHLLGGRRRMLSVGCGSGEEPYSIAMIAASLGLEAEVVGLDLLPENIGVARKALYPSDPTDPAAFDFLREDVPPEFRKYFIPAENRRWRVDDNVRQRVKFEQADIRSSDISVYRPDIVVCRNLLYYFDLETQNRLREKLQKAAPAALV